MTSYRGLNQSAISLASKLGKIINNFLKTCSVPLEFKPYSSSILCTALFPSLHAVLFLGVFHSWESSLPCLEIIKPPFFFFFLQQWRKAHVVLLLYLWHQSIRRQSGLCEHLLLHDAVILTSRMSCLRMGVKLNNISLPQPSLSFCSVTWKKLQWNILHFLSQKPFGKIELTLHYFCYFRQDSYSPVLHIFILK